MLYTDDWYYLTMAIDINKSQLLLSWLWYNLPKCLNIIFVFMDSRTGISPLRIALNTLLTSYSVSSGWKWYLLHTPLGCFLGPLLLWQSAHFWKLPRESTHLLRFNYVPWFGRFFLARPIIANSDLSSMTCSCQGDIWHLQTRTHVHCSSSVRRWMFRVFCFGPTSVRGPKPKHTKHLPPSGW